MSSRSKTDEDLILKTAYKAIDDKFGEDIVILDISNISTIADYFVIATGKNPNQIRAIANGVEEEFFKIGVRLNHSEGLQNATWVLQDFNNIIVHIFDPTNRDFYDMERVWIDAKRIDISN